MKAECILECGNRLGEGPIWDDRSGWLYWVDVTAAEVNGFEPKSGEHRRWGTGEHVGSLSVREGGGLILALKNGFSTLDLESGRVTRICECEAELDNNRFNDGRCDREGRFLAGSLVYSEDQPKGSLWRLDPDHRVSRVLSGITVPNGLCWSPDGGTMYFVDTPTREIRAYAYDRASGTPSDPKLFRKVDDTPGWPDGSIVDSEGFLWNGEWDGARVVRYAPDGSVDRVVEVPARRATCAALGGPDLKTLYITTAWDRMSEAERAEWPLSGHLFAVPVDVPGLPDPRYRG
ncbi:MAG: SMP-30/gluconolactonase/LRE family protein [Geminicoccaceae bacterium]|nr:SMP-30/gluconolactonase/LRE family protein [Geminicoccaceae bacterium]